MFPLKKGNRNDKVRVLQYGLGLVTDGIFGPNTERFLKKWQRNMFLKETGEMSEEVWNSFFQFELQDPKHLYYANHLLGIREQDVTGDGNPDNRSEVIDAMTSSVWSWWEAEYNEEGPPWCAIFISFLLHVSYDFPFKDARVKKWLDYLTESEKAIRLTNTKKFSKNKIYIGGWVRSSGFGHIYFVDPKKTLENNNPGKVFTIEGNTNDDGSRDGDGVYSRIRRITDSDFLFEVLANS